MVNMIPGTEKDPFPNGYISTEIENKLFKHVLFHTDKNLTKFRIRSIGHDWTELLEAATGELTIPLSGWSFAKDKFRMKAVLNEPQYGVLESDWVSQQVLGKMKKRKLNQFRVRGVAKEGMRSRWMYSEIKDEEDDLVVFQLLHDILDIMTSVHESDFTAIIETSLVDLLAGLFNQGREDELEWIKTLDVGDTAKYRLSESVRTSGMGIHQLDELKRLGMSETAFNELMISFMEFQESKKLKVQEATQLIAKHFQKHFMEQKKFSAEDYAEHARLYKLKDAKNDQVLDYMLDHILLLSVEDAYEKAIEEANLVALLHNDEELRLLLKDAYNFKAESALVELFAEVEFVDSFVTYFSDGLSLFLEPNFDEAKVAQIREEAVPVLLLVYREVYIPMLILDSTVAELFNELIDDATGIQDRLSSSLHSLRYSYFDEDTGESWTLIEDFLVEIFETLILLDDDMEKHIDIDLFSKVIGSLKKDSLKMLITYDPVEAIEFITKLVENVRVSAMTAGDVKTEQYRLNLSDNIETQDLTIKGPTEDVQKITKLEGLLLTDSSDSVSNEETQYIIKREGYDLLNLSNFKTIVENYSMLLAEGYELQDILNNKDIFLEYNLKAVDEISTENAKSDSVLLVSHYIAIIHTLLINNTTDDWENIYDVPAYAVYHLELLYRLRPKGDLFSGVFMRQQSEEEFELAEMFPLFYRYDDYFEIMWNLKEDIHVHLGELDLTGSRFPLSYFTLGRNTLEGES